MRRDADCLETLTISGASRRASIQRQGTTGTTANDRARKSHLCASPWPCRPFSRALKPAQLDTPHQLLSCALPRRLCSSFSTSANAPSSPGGAASSSSSSAALRMMLARSKPWLRSARTRSEPNPGMAPPSEPPRAPLCKPQQPPSPQTTSKPTISRPKLKLCAALTSGVGDRGWEDFGNVIVVAAVGTATTGVEAAADTIGTEVATLASPSVDLTSGDELPPQKLHCLHLQNLQ
mmetsp:Transcript_11096/g.28431  ORF Transcript_11096/g.28431 Transcript_11096/m.28431 type:complete len:235 (-) Transcript_11096:321-1025(-)